MWIEYIDIIVAFVMLHLLWSFRTSSDKYLDHKASHGCKFLKEKDPQKDIF